jgi:hypothetical protein
MQKKKSFHRILLQLYSIKTNRYTGTKGSIKSNRNKEFNSRKKLPPLNSLFMNNYNYNPISISHFEMAKYPVKGQLAL